MPEAHATALTVADTGRVVVVVADVGEVGLNVTAVFAAASTATHLLVRGQATAVSAWPAVIAAGVDADVAGELGLNVTARPRASTVVH